MKIFLTLLLSTVTLLSSAQEGYTIHGKIEGNAEGRKVFLRYNDYLRNEAIDTTTIVNGQFKFEGKVSTPAQHQIIIDKTADGQESSERNWVSTLFYLENSNITYEGHIDSLTTYFYNPKLKAAVITGSKTEDESKAFKLAKREITKDLAKLDREYSEKYHMPALEGVYNTEEGIRITKQRIPIERRAKQFTIDYVKNNPKSVVAYDQALYEFLGIFVEITEEQIDELVAAVKTSWEGTPRYDQFIQYANKAKTTALHSQYQDFELTDPEGKKVKISSLIPEGSYCMLEFWASWCGPCRAEIPHLAKTHQKYKDAGFKIISISIDENDKHWRKAMEQEKMIWPQLNDPKGFGGEISQAYNITGIPFAILLDPSGKIINFNMRGARLDNALLEIYKF